MNTANTPQAIHSTSPHDARPRLRVGVVLCLLGIAGSVFAGVVSAWWGMEYSSSSSSTAGIGTAFAMALGATAVVSALLALVGLFLRTRHTAAVVLGCLSLALYLPWVVLVLPSVATAG